MDSMKLGLLVADIAISGLGGVRIIFNPGVNRTTAIEPYLNHINNITKAIVGEVPGKPRCSHGCNVPFIPALNVDKPSL